MPADTMRTGIFRDGSARYRAARTEVTDGLTVRTPNRTRRRAARMPPAATANTGSAQPVGNAMSEQNKAIAKRAIDAWNSRDLEVFDEVAADDYIDHDPQNPYADVHGPEGMKKLVRMYLGAFSDQRFLVNEQIAEGDFVTTRWTATGTNDGEMMGMHATGKPAVVQGITINRLRDGKLVEGWTCWDALGMMQQLGLVRPAHSATA
ncbi:ester cyclase [Nocardia bovistercoris]|uniref:Ester cyclase n=1 Tax=Nocardia bovistercoris TaxID=2785916 RepID=A0A931IJ70_9NOCA|nr:ester cyclase [Nocardia bovistercoris]MBH0781588.1 ester cyclase [Nocardia bovistercoris]